MRKMKANYLAPMVRIAARLRLTPGAASLTVYLLMLPSMPIADPQVEGSIENQFAEKKVEPNSGLGEAITYCLKRWDRLTLVLHEPGAPLDSNLVERTLKKCTLQKLLIL